MNSLKQARAELAAEVKGKEDDLAKLRSKLAKLDELLSDEEPVKPRGKPGPKPKNKTESEEAPVRKKPGPKPKNKGEEPTKGKPGPKPKGVKTEGKSRAAEGRRAVARGERPPIRQSMRTVMGTDVCNAEMIAERLDARGWRPSASNPKQYIGFLLSSSKEDFQRVPDKGRGFYRVKPEAAETTSEAAPSKAAEPEKAEANGAAKRAKSTDEVLKEAGLDLGGPFGG